MATVRHDDVGETSILLDRINFLLEHVPSSSGATSASTRVLSSLTNFRPSDLLSVIELILSSQLPIPNSLRTSEDRGSRLTLSKLLLGLLADDLLPSIHHSNVDSIIKGGEIGFALDRVDPRRLADGEMDEEEARSLAQATWRVAEAKGWEEHYNTGNTSTLTSCDGTVTSHVDGQLHDVRDERDTTVTIQYHDSAMLSTDHVLSPTTSSSALGSLTLSLRSVDAETVTDDVTVTGSYRGIGPGGYLGMGAELGGEGSWRVGVGDFANEGAERRDGQRIEEDDESSFCSCSEDEHLSSKPDFALHNSRSGSASHDLDSTIDMITSSFSNPSHSIPIRYDGWLQVVDLDEELRSFEMEKKGREGVSWTVEGFEPSRSDVEYLRSHCRSGQPHSVHRHHNRHQHSHRSSSKSKTTLSLLEERTRTLGGLAMFQLARGGGGRLNGPAARA